MKVFRNTMGKTRNLTAGEASIKISLSKQMGIDIQQRRRLQKEKKRSLMRSKPRDSIGYDPLDISVFPH